MYSNLLWWTTPNMFSSQSMSASNTLAVEMYYWRSCVYFYVKKFVMDFCGTRTQTHMPGPSHNVHISKRPTKLQSIVAPWIHSEIRRGGVIKTVLWVRMATLVTSIACHNILVLSWELQITEYRWQHIYFLSRYHRAIKCNYKSAINTHTRIQSNLS